MGIRHGTARPRQYRARRRSTCRHDAPCLTETLKLSVEDFSELEGHPKLGASWEGFALEQVLSVVGSGEAFYWGTHAGAELDLLLFRRGRRYGIEFKYGAAPTMTKSLHVALADLELDRAWIVYPGPHRYSVHEKVEVLPLVDVPVRLAAIGRGGRYRRHQRRLSPERHGTVRVRGNLY